MHASGGDVHDLGGSTAKGICSLRFLFFDSTNRSGMSS